MKTEIIYTKEEIEQAVLELADKIERVHHGSRDLVLVGVLNGSYMFISDLSRNLLVPHRVDFISTESYGSKGNKQGDVKLLLDTKENLKDKTVIVIEDIIDSGNTIGKVKEFLSAKGAKKVETCSLLRRESNKIAPDYYGLSLSDDDWVIGYGLDYKGEGRHLPSINKITIS